MIKKMKRTTRTTNTRMITDINWLKIDFSATQCQGWPKLRFYIDNDLYHDFEFVSGHDSVTLPIDFLPGDHELVIELHGKTFANTLLEGDVIVQDQTVTLERMWLDGIDLPDHFKYTGSYRDRSGTISRALTWGINLGTWSWQFQCPIIPWIIDEKHRQIDAKHDHELSRLYSPKKNQVIVDALDRLEKKINEIDF